MRILPVLLALGLACSGVATDSIATPPAELANVGADYAPAWSVILWGSTERAEAEAWLERYRAAGGPVREGWPRVVDSGTIAMLKPGFFIVEAAELDTEDEANAAMARFRALGLQGVDTTGTYVREVRVPWAEEVEVDEVVPERWRVVVIWNSLPDGEETSEDWGFFTDDVAKAAERAGVLVAYGGTAPEVTVRRGEDVVGSVDVKRFLAEPAIGYVFHRPGAEPEFHAHAMPVTVLDAASRYFGVTLGE